MFTGKRQSSDSLPFSGTITGTMTYLNTDVEAQLTFDEAGIADVKINNWAYQFLYKQSNIFFFDVLSAQGGDYYLSYEVKSLAALNYCEADCSMYLYQTNNVSFLTYNLHSVADWDAVPLGEESDTCGQGLISGKGEITFSAYILKPLLYCPNLTIFDIHYSPAN